MCNEILHIPFTIRAPAPEVISPYLDIVRRAADLSQILCSRVPYKGGFAGLKETSAINDINKGMKRQWVDAVEQIATDKIQHGATIFSNMASGYLQRCATTLIHPVLWLRRNGTRRTLAELAE
jgi:hypothetical protein